jgi:hypothetical protein
VAKFALTIFAVVILFQHMREVSSLSLTAKDTALSAAALRPELIHSAGGLLVLFAAMTLSVFKPWGATPYGRRRMSNAEIASRDEVPVPQRGLVLHGRPIGWGRIIGYHAVGLFVLFAIIMHLTGMHHH